MGGKEVHSEALNRTARSLRDEVLPFCKRFDEMRFRRPRLLLKKEDCGTTPILSNPFKRLSLCSTLIIVVVVGSAVVIAWLWIRRQRQDRLKTSHIQAHLAATREKARFRDMKTIPRARLNLKAPVEGAFGTLGKVTRATYGACGSNRDVAAKILGTWKDAAKVTEVHHLLRKQHPNIAEFIGISKGLGASGFQPFYWVVSAWYVRGSLHDHLKINTLSYIQLLYLTESIANGLDFLHTERTLTEHGNNKPPMAHRNIKSTNILIKDNRTACIADFEMVVIFKPGKEAQGKRYRIGSTRYAAPEILESEIAWTHQALQAADMYATAFVLWEMLSRCAISDELSEYKVPFEDEVEPNPTISEMREVVVRRHMRPPIKKSWRRDDRFTPYITIVEDCWDSDPRVRWRASRMQKRLRHLISFVEGAQHDRTIRTDT